MKQRNKLNEHTQDLQTLLFLRKEEEHFQLFIPVQISLTLVIVEYLLHLSSRVRLIVLWVVIKSHHWNQVPVCTEIFQVKLIHFYIIVVHNLLKISLMTIKLSQLKVVHITNSKMIGLWLAVCTIWHNLEIL